MVKLKRIMIGGLAVVASALTMQAQTLTQDWKVTEGLPAASNARWGVGKAGKIYTNDKSVPQILAFTAEGSSVVKASCKGTAISVDDAGNIIVNDKFSTADSSTTFKIFPADGSDVKDLTVTLPNGVSAGRMDFIGRTVGNVLSETGGAFYITPATSDKVAKIFVANGVQDFDRSMAFSADVACAADGVAQPVGNNPSDDDFIVRPSRTKSDFFRVDNSAAVKFTQVGTSNLTAGCDAVMLNGTLYTFETSGTNYVDGFQVVNRTSNEVVAAHENEFTSAAAKPNQNALSVEKVDEYTARVYQYVPGQMAAQYTFSIPKPTYPKRYILGQNEDGEAWDPTRGIEMTTEDGVWYTATVTTVAGRENFAIVTDLAENNDDGGWEYVNSRRYGLATDNQDGAVAEEIMMRRTTNAVRLGIGAFFIRFGGDFNYLYVVPTRLYAFGNSNKADGHGWDSADQSYMAESDPATPGVFTFSPIDLKVEGKAVGEEGTDDMSYFAFKTNADGDWNVANGNRWCPDHKNGEMTDNTEYRDFGKNTDGAFCIKNGAYELTVDLNTRTIKAVYLTATSVEEVEGTAARVIAADGAIRIEGEAGSVSVYNAAGQAVAVNTQERTLSVARGMYVVVVDGRATKVVVR